jgi:hypothetical protein
MANIAFKLPPSMSNLVFHQIISQLVLGGTNFTLELLNIVHLISVAGNQTLGLENPVTNFALEFFLRYVGVAMSRQNSWFFEGFSADLALVVSLVAVAQFVDHQVFL